MQDSKQQDGTPWLALVLWFALGACILGPIFSPMLHLDAVIDFLISPFFHKKALITSMIFTSYSLIVLVAGRIFTAGRDRLVFGIAFALAAFGYVAAHLVAYFSTH